MSLADEYGSLMNQGSPVDGRASNEPVPAANDSSYENQLGSEYGRLMDSEESRTRFAARRAMQTTPEASARTRWLAKQTGLPQDFIFRNSSEVQKKLDEDTAVKQLQTQPVLADLFASDPIRAGILSKDVDQMSKVMRSPLFRLGTQIEFPDGSKRMFMDRPTVSDFPLSESQNYAQASARLEHAREQWDLADFKRMFDEQPQWSPTAYEWASEKNKNLWNSLTAGLYNINTGIGGLAEFGLDAINPYASYVFGPDNWVNDARVAVDEWGAGQKAIADDLINSRMQSMGVVERGIYQGLQSISTQAPGLLAGLFTGNPWIALGTMGLVEGGNSYADARDKDLDPTRALLYSTSNALIEVGTERLPILKLFDDISLGTPLWKTLLKQNLIEAPSEQVATLFQDLNEWAMLNPEKTFKEYLAERPERAAETAIATIVGTSIQSGSMHVVGNLAPNPELDARAERLMAQDARRATLAERTADHLRSINESLGQGQAIKNGEEGRETVRDVLNQAAPDQTFSIGVRELSGILTDANVSVSDLERIAPSLANQYAEALTSGADVVLSRGEFFGAFAQTEVFDALLDHVRESPNAMTLAESQAFAQSNPDSYRADAETIGALADVDEEFSASKERVRLSILDSLNKTGRWTEGKNEVDAAVFSAYFATRARQLGQSPEQVLNSMQLSFQATGVPGAQVLDQQELSDLSAPEGQMDQDQGRTQRFKNPVELEDGSQLLGFENPEKQDVFYGIDPSGREISVRRDQVVPDSIVASQDGNRTAETVKDGLQRLRDARAAFEADVLQQGANTITGDLNLVNEDVREAAESRIAKLPAIDQARLYANLEIHKGTAWAAATVKGLAYREMLDRAMAGQDISNLEKNAIWGKQDMAATKLIKAFKKYPEQGDRVLQLLLNSYDFIGGNRKAENDISTSFANCEPSRACAVHCYAAGSNARPNEIAKSEFTEFMIETFPEEMSNKILADYLGTAAGQAGLSLRLNDKGDLSPAQVNLIALLNEKGLAVQVFSKRPELLRSLSDMNLKMLSIDSSNLGVALTNPDLRLAVTITDEMTEEMLLPIHDRVSVYLPVNLKGHTVTAEELRERFPTLYPSMRKETLCPVDGGKMTTKPGTSFVDIRDGLTEKGVWTCTSCDLTGCAGCFHGERKTTQRKAQTVSMTDLTKELKLKRVRNELQTNLDELLALGGIDGELHGQLTAALSSGERAILEIAHKGTEGGIDQGSGGTLAQSEAGRDGVGSNAGELNQGGGIRGSFSPSDNVISAFEGADLSTVLHEGAHFFFENDIRLANSLIGMPALRPGEERILSDVHTLLTWLGIEGDLEQQLNHWNSLTFEQRVDFHEQTAESFERYLFSGIAPSIELQSVFQTLRSWMLRVYESVTKFMDQFGRSKKLNSEVREVFDRMLASEEEIQNAKSARSMMPLFAQRDPAMMSQEEWESYQADNEAQDALAIADMQAKSLRDMQWAGNRVSEHLKRLQKENREIRAVVRGEARQSVMEQPIYRAWSFLTNRIKRDDKVEKPAPRKSKDGPIDSEIDTLFTAIAKLGGLNREELAEQWGVDPKDKSPMPLFGKYVIRATEGRSIDDIAQALSEEGYLDLDESGKWDLGEFEDKFRSSMAGEDVYSRNVDYDVLYIDEADMGLAEVANPELIGAGRFARAELEDMGVSAEKIQRLVDLRMVADVGWPADLVAEKFGFGSGIELIDELYRSDNPNAATDRLADQIMTERFGELGTEAGMKAAANAAVANQFRARSLAREFEAIARAVGKNDRGAQVAAMGEQYASNVVGRTKLGELRPWKYENAAKRAGKKAREALAKGNHKEAYSELRNQIFLEAAARKTHEKIKLRDRGVLKLKSLEKDAAQRKMRGDWLIQLNALLARFDLTKVKREKDMPLNDWVIKESDRLSSVVPELPDWILDESNVMPHRQMTVEQFEGLLSTVDQLEKMARREQEQYISVRNQTVQQEEQSILDELERANPKAFEGGEPKKYRKDALTRRQEKSGRRKSAFDASFMNLENLLDIASKGQGKAIFESLFGRLSSAADRQVELVRSLGNFLSEATSAYSVKERIDMAFKKEKVPGTDYYLTREQRIAVALFYGSEQGRQRLTDGNRYSANDLMAILDSLDKKDWDLAQRIWDMSDQIIWPQLAALNERTVGIAPQKIKPLQIQTRFGTYTGGYVPLVYDGDMDTRSHDLDTNSSVQELLGGTVGTAATARSASKSRVEKVNRPLDLSLRGMAYKLNETAHDITHREAVADTYRLLQRTKVADALRSILGPDAYNAMLAHVREVAVKPKTPTGWQEKFFWHLRKNALVAMMGASVQTVLINVMGTIPAMRRVGIAGYLKGIGHFTSPQAIERYKWILDKSPYMAKRLASFDRDMNEEIRRLTVGGVRIMPSLEVWFAGLAVMDRAVTMPLWISAYEQGMERHKNDEAAAVLYADRIVRQTQGAGRTVDLSRVAGGTGAAGEFKRILTMVYNFFNAQLGSLRRGSAEASFYKDQGRRSKAAMMLTLDVLGIVVIPAFLEALVRGQCEGEDGETDVGDLAKCMGRSSTMFAASLFPIVRDLVPYTWKKLDSSFVGGYSVHLSPIESGLESIGRGAASTVRVVTGEGEDRDINQILKGLGWAFGLPSSQAVRTLDGYRALMEGDTDNPAALLFGPPR